MRRLALFAMVTLAAAQAAWCEVGASVFSQGHTRLSVGAGYGSFNNKDYFILGLGAGYYLFDGLEAGVSGEGWMGSKPHIYKVSPELTYVLYQWGQWKPYLGAFYRHTFYDTLTDLDSAGARAGVITPLSERLYLSAGLVYESFFHCDKAVYTDCSLVYPELGISFSY